MQAHESSHAISKRCQKAFAAVQAVTELKAGNGADHSTQHSTLASPTPAWVSTLSLASEPAYLLLMSPTSQSEAASTPAQSEILSPPTAPTSLASLEHSPTQEGAEVSL